jgi:hypothetical protein
MSNNTNGNPLLYSLGNVILQPYWLVIVQLLIFHGLQRCWNLVQYGLWFVTFEMNHQKQKRKNDSDNAFTKNDDDIGYCDICQRKHKANDQSCSAVRSKQQQLSSNFDTVFHRDKTEVSEELKKLEAALQLDLFDLVFAIIPIAHFIWYCVIQADCTSSSTSPSIWQCYNIFGYRLENYVFPSSYSIVMNFAYKNNPILQKVQCRLCFKPKVAEVPPIVQASALKTCWSVAFGILITALYYLNFALLSVDIIYILTNALPMGVVFVWLTALYCLILAILYFGSRYFSKQIAKNHLKKKIGFHTVLLSSLLLITGPLFISILYNYSQYFYFGDGYVQTMQDEYNARSTQAYFDYLKSSVSQIGHSVLDFL